MLKITAHTRYFRQNPVRQNAEKGGAKTLEFIPQCRNARGMKKFSSFYLFLRFFFLFLSLIQTTSFAQSNKPALVIIDMQPEFVTRDGNQEKPENQKKVKQIIATQLSAIQAAKKADASIILIAFDNFGLIDTRLKNATKGYVHTSVFIKDTEGMFDDGNSSSSQLDKFLKGRGIHTLIITGANGGACVYASIYGALRHNYKVIAYDNGIADFNYPDFIYPYTNQFNDMRANPKFIEVTKLGDIFGPPAIHRGLKPAVAKAETSKKALKKSCETPTVGTKMRDFSVKTIDFLEGKK